MRIFKIPDELRQFYSKLQEFRGDFSSDFERQILRFCRLFQKPQHISKIVEYFERKQVGGGGSAISHKLDFLDSSGKKTNFHTPVRRSWMQSDGQPLNRGSSLDYYTRRKLFEKPFTGGSHVFSKRSANQRLLVCEGAVKSKLPIFDKK